MAKTPKKRNKPYRGQDAAVSDNPTVRRYTAVERNKVNQWWHDHKKVAKPAGIAIGGLAIFIWLVIESIRIIF